MYSTLQRVINYITTKREKRGYTMNNTIKNDIKTMLQYATTQSKLTYIQLLNDLTTIQDLEETFNLTTKQVITITNELENELNIGNRFIETFKKDYGIAIFTIDNYTNSNGITFTYELGYKEITNSGIEYDFFPTLEKAIKQEIILLSGCIEIEKENDNLDCVDTMQKLIIFFKNELAKLLESVC
jgi:hypothetical protein